MSRLIKDSELIMAIANWQQTLMPGWNSPDDADSIIYETLEEVCKLIESQPPADNWIPVSEREPEDPCVYTVEDSSPYTVKKFGKPQRYVWKVLPYSLEMYYRLVAWKPIDPEPYKEE